MILERRPAVREPSESSASSTQWSTATPHRGPDSAGVLNLVKETCDRLGSRAVALLGNHEVDFLDWLAGDEADATWLLADWDFTTLSTFLAKDELAQLVRTIDLSTHDGLVEINRGVRDALRSRHGTCSPGCARDRCTMRPSIRSSSTRVWTKKPVSGGSTVRRK